MTTFVFFTGPAPQPFSAPIESDGAALDVHVRRPAPYELDVNSQAPAGLAIPNELLSSTWTLWCEGDEAGDALMSLAIGEVHNEEMEIHETHVGRLLVGYLPLAQRVTIIDAGSPRDSWTWRHLHTPAEFLAYIAQESENWGPVNAVYSPQGAP